MRNSHPDGSLVFLFLLFFIAISSLWMSLKGIFFMFTKDSISGPCFNPVRSTPTSAFCVWRFGCELHRSWCSLYPLGNLLGAVREMLHCEFPAHMCMHSLSHMHTNRHACTHTCRWAYTHTPTDSHTHAHTCPWYTPPGTLWKGNKHVSQMLRWTWDEESEKVRFRD